MNVRQNVFRWSFILMLVAGMISCGRKDVDRSGQIRMRGERPINMNGHRSGDLLQRGTASWYGNPFHGRQTANGERYNMHDLTAAHKSLPFGAFIRVVNDDNGRSTVVRINDRGPFIRGRIIDLSKKAALEIGMLGPGTANVSLYLETEMAEMRRQPQAYRPSVPVDDGFWTIQVGSFSEQNRAERMARRTQSFPGGSRIEPYGNMYRVRIGQFRTKAEAAHVARELYNAEIECWITFQE